MPCAQAYSQQSGPPCTIELRFAASDLANKDLFSLSDPFVLCHTVRNGLPSTKLGRTETVQDDLNPVWVTTIHLDYSPADSPATAILVDIFDRDSPDSDSMSKHDFLGRAVFRLQKLLDAPHARLDLPLRPARNLLIPPPTFTFSSSPLSDDAQTQHAYVDDDRDDADTIDSDNSTWYNNNNNNNNNTNNDNNNNNNNNSPPSPSSSSLSPSLNLRNHLFTGGPRDTDLSSLSKSVRSRPSFASSALSGAPRQSAATRDLVRATTTTRATKKVRGTLSVFAETLAPTPGMAVVFRVHSALLRDPCSFSSPFSRRITQYYEIQRERAEGARTEWSCVFRSRDGVTVDRNNYVAFDDVRLDERTLNNLQPDRKLRIAFFRRHIRSQHELISYVSTSLADILTSRFRDASVALRMEGQFADDNDLGNVLVKRVDRWVAEGRAASVERSPAREEVRIEVRADHFLPKRYISSLNDEPSGQTRRLRQRPTFLSMH